MPTYEYQCEKCKHEFSEVLRVDDRKIPESAPCPSCAEVGVRQIISRPGGILFDSKVQPTSQFKETMQRIKAAHKHDRHAKIKDY